MSFIIQIFIYLTFYIICGYATTDILRLCKGSTVNIWESDCFCPVCGYKLRLVNQIPILSYIICNGKCKQCGSKIPKTEFFLEILVFTTLSTLVSLLNFSWYSYIISFFFYELIKCLFLSFYGIKETGFAKNLLCSLCNNLVLWFLLAILFLLHTIL